MEIFLALFPGDQNIVNASVELLACVFDATEKTIVYYLSSTCEFGFYSCVDCRAETDMSFVHSEETVQGHC
jgi:hypothetical protein